MESKKSEPLLTDNDEHIPQLTRGQKLYHYTSATGLKGICEGEFWITERAFLNDVKEFQVATQLFCEIVDKHIKDPANAMKVKGKICNEVDMISNPGTDDEDIYCGDYVISFSLDKDSILLWSEYSDFFGYCMEFDGDKLIDMFNKKNEYRFLHGQVIYDQNEQINIIENTVKKEIFEAENVFSNINSWDDFNYIDEDTLEYISKWLSIFLLEYNMFFKLECFSGEREYRFIFMSSHDNKAFKKDVEQQFFRVKNEVLIPYIRKEIVSLESLKSVIIGPKNKSDIAEKGLRSFFRNMKLKVDVQSSKMPIRY